jgi:thioredoxin-related protein
MTRIAIIILTAFALCSTGIAQEVEWMSFEEAIKRNEKDPRKIIIDVYTDWCGWCTKMDKETFHHPVISKILSEKYYAVKFDAETFDTIHFANHVYINQGQGRRATHDLAITLLQGKMSYPSIVFLDEKNRGITALAGYRTATDMEPLLHFISASLYAKKVDFKEYTKTFKSEIK